MIFFRILAQISEVKYAYLEQFHSMAPNYLAEEYCDVIWQNGAEKVSVNLQVSPFCGQDSGLRMLYKREVNNYTFDIFFLFYGLLYVRHVMQRINVIDEIFCKLTLLPQR